MMLLAAILAVSPAPAAACDQPVAEARFELGSSDPTNVQLVLAQREGCRADIQSHSDHWRPISSAAYGASDPAGTSIRLVADLGADEALGQYRPAFRFGEHGLVVYGPYLPSLAGARITLAVGDQTYGVIAGDATLGNVLLGPAGAIAACGSDLSVASDAPPELTSAACSAAAQALDYYRAAWPEPLAVSAEMIIAHDATGPMGLIGDVTPPALLTLRLGGAIWTSPPEDAANALHRLIAHEIFHVFQLAAGIGADQPDWLREGSAEYAALLARSHALEHGPAQVASRLELAGNSCLSLLADGSFLDLGSGRSYATYSCGLLAVWASDAGPGRQPGERFWDNLNQRAGETDERWRMARRVLGASTHQDWSRIAAELSSDELQVEFGVNDDAYRLAILGTLIAETCAGVDAGIEISGENMRLKTGADCGALSGDPDVISIAGQALLEDAEAAHGMLAGCHADDRLAVGLGEGRSFQLPCPVDVEIPSPGFTIRPRPTTR
jgi:hypothetical protein